ncbi:hypothetical protein APHAL10511_008722 [Amanita phalloides]|nr:hypothetical protein APHAL10511_008722 [Amanita phalloides]
MSLRLLAGVSRSRPPAGLQTCLRAQTSSVIFQQTRGMRKGPPKVEKDDKGQIKKRNKKEGAAGVFSRSREHVGSEADGTLAGLAEFKPKYVTEKTIGKACVFSFSDNDPVRKFGLPKRLLLEYRILSRPYTVIRGVTVDLIGKLKAAKDRSSVESRLVLTGRSGAGKSCVLLQAVEYCAQSNWVVIYIPRGVNLVNSTTPYAYDLRTRTYLQPQFAFQTLQRTLSVNQHLLSSLQTSKKHVFEKRELPVGSSIVDLIGIGIKDALSAPFILDALVNELGQQTKHPVLLAVDDFQALYCKTAYRDPFFSTICSYHLSMPRMILEFACGKRTFARGAVLGAITYSDPAYALPLELREALGMAYDQATSGYDKRSKIMKEYTVGLRAICVPEQLSMAEAGSLFEVWKEEKVMGCSAYDEVFLSKYSESSGNAGELVRGVLSSLA